MALKLTEKADGDIIIVEIYGELDSSSVAAFTLGFREISGRHKAAKYVMDMKGLDFISSAGWTAFLNEFNELSAANSEIKLAAMQHDAKRVYSLVGVDGVIGSYETVKEAVNSYAKKA